MINIYSKYVNERRKKEMSNNQSDYQVKINEDPAVTIFYDGGVYFDKNIYYFTASYSDYGGNIGYAEVDEITWDGDIAPPEHIIGEIEDSIKDEISNKF